MLDETSIQKLSDDDLREEVACFGTMWNPRDSVCVNECIAQARCLFTVSRRFLPQQALEMGLSEVQTDGSMKPLVPELDAYELAGTYDLDPHGVEYAKSLYTTPSWGLPVIQPDGTLKPSMSGPPPAPPGSAAADAGGTAPILESTEILADSLQDDVTEGDDSVNVIDQKAIEALDNIQKSKHEEQAEFDANAAPIIEDEDPGKEEEMPPKKKATKKKVVKKQPTKKKVVKKQPTKKKVVKKKPEKKVAAKTVTKKAPEKKQPVTKKKVVKKASKKKAATKVKATKAKTDTTFATRFNNEFKKPFIAQLPWGHTLERDYKGKTHKVTLTQEGFKYEGELYPTLYAVQLEIEGRAVIGGKVQTSMSTQRFFRL